MLPEMVRVQTTELSSYLTNFKHKDLWHTSLSHHYQACAHVLKLSHKIIKGDNESTGPPTKFTSLVYFVMTGQSFF